jgi:uncharacterized protein involved in exopolysaccharide biosynthesis
VNSLTPDAVRALVLARWRLVAIAALLAGGVAGVASLLKHREYRAHASFVPQAADASRSRLSGIAAQLGVSVPSVDRSQSPDFYAELCHSRTVVDQVIGHSYSVADLRATGPVMLADVFRIHDSDSLVTRDKLFEAVYSRLAISTGLRTGLISLDLAAPSRQLAIAMLGEIIASVNRFTIAARQQQAQAETDFTEQRLGDARHMLQGAEDDLVAFSASNREYRTSPSLSAQHDRLQRAVDMRQQLYVSLSQLYEQSRIDALRTTQTLVIVDTPTADAWPISRHVVRNTLLAFCCGAALAIFVLVAKASTRPPAVR